MTEASKKPGYVYAMQPEGMDIVKIGATISPESRLNQMRLYSPQPMVFRHLLRVRSSRHAHIHENQILAWSHPSSHHGEWRTDLDLIDSLFECVSPAADAKAEFEIKPHEPVRHGPRDLVVQSVLCQFADAEMSDELRHQLFRRFRISYAKLQGMRSKEDIPANLPRLLSEFLQDTAA